MEKLKEAKNIKLLVGGCCALTVAIILAIAALVLITGDDDNDGKATTPTGSATTARQGGDDATTAGQDGGGDAGGIQIPTDGTPTALKGFSYYVNDKVVTGNIRDLCLLAHNKAREVHKDTGPLEWDVELAKTSEEWALNLAAVGTMVHSDTTAGENLFTGSHSLTSTAFTPVHLPAHAVHGWYAESYEPGPYNYNSNAFDSATGHFTQLVWKGSTTVGCGAAAKSVSDGPFVMTTIFIVSQYGGGGNLEGSFTENVRPLKSGDATRKFTVEELLPSSPSCVDLATPGTGCRDSSAWCGAVGALCTCTCN